MSVQSAYEFEVEARRRYSEDWSNAVPPQYFPSDTRLIDARTDETPLLASEEVPAMETAPEYEDPSATVFVSEGDTRSATYEKLAESFTFPARSVER